jgi:hypothetical protein
VICTRSICAQVAFACKGCAHKNCALLRSCDQRPQLRPSLGLMNGGPCQQALRSDWENDLCYLHNASGGPSSYVTPP